MTEQPISTAVPTLETTRLAALEKKLALQSREIVTLSKMLLSAQAALKVEDEEPQTAAPVVPQTAVPDATPMIDPETLTAMVEVMKLSLHLTRVPLVMRLGYFRRRHQRRLAAALIRHKVIDPKWYAATYPDVASSGMDPVLYFITKGSVAGHFPHPKFKARGKS